MSDNYFGKTDALDAWFLARRGKFTASEDYKLLGDMKKDTWGSHIEAKAIEMSTEMWEKPELEEAKSLLWGKVYEYPAYEAYVSATKNYSMTYMGSEHPIFLDYELLTGESGGTPDVGNINDSFKMDYGAELKCPKNPAYHFRRLSWKSQWDIKENYILAYTQIQKLIMVTGAFGWDFSSYDDRQISKSRKSKIIEVKPDKKFQDNLHVRMELAIRAKYKLLAETFNDESIKDRGAFLKAVSL